MFRWKDYVYEVYKERSFSKAAENLYISQPYLSAKVKGVEEEIGAMIFDRSASPIRITEIGEAYIKAVEEINKTEEEFKNYINGVKGLKRGNLTVGASNVFAAYTLPAIITEYKNRYPAVEISLIEGNTKFLEELLSEGSLDLVIDNNHYDRALYDRELYSREHILLAVPKKFELCKKLSKYAITEEKFASGEYLSDVFPTVPLSHFKDIPFIMLSAGNDTRIRGDALCSAAGFHPQIVLELNQQATAYMTAATEIGATFVSDTLAAKLPNHHSLCYFKLEGEEAKRKVYFYYKKRKVKTRAMEEFVKIIENKT